MGYYVLGFSPEQLIAVYAKYDYIDRDYTNIRVEIVKCFDSASIFMTYDEITGIKKKLFEYSDKILWVNFTQETIAKELYSPENLKIYELKLLPVEIEKQKEGLA